MIRPLQSSDAPALLRLWNAHAPYDLMSPTLLREKVWDDEGFQASMALVDEHAGVLRGFIMGVVRPHQAGLRGIIKLLVVAAPHRRQGVGRALLQAVEEVLVQADVRALRVGESAPNYLVPGIDVRYTPALLFFEGQGYVRVGETYNLTAPLDALPLETALDERRLHEQGIVVRRATGADAEAVMVLLEAHWPPWRIEVWRALENDPVSLHLALQGAAVVAFSAYDTNNAGLPWFGPMGTAPEARGHGLGRVLLLRCLRDQRDQGHAHSIIPWVGPVGFYAHHAGACIDRVFYRYEKAVA